MYQNLLKSIAAKRPNLKAFNTDPIESGSWAGLSTKEHLLEAFGLPLTNLVELAVATRRSRIAIGESSHVCASGYLPHYDEKGCEMSCSFCGYPEKIYEKGSRQFITELTEGAIVEDALQKIKAGATRYKIVSLGCSIRQEEYEAAKRALHILFDEMGFETICLSFGVMPENRIAELVDLFGNERIVINHNLEVGNPDAYQRLIGNNKQVWHQRYETIRIARHYGLKVCAGGLVGIGESVDEQADLILTLRTLDVTSTPFNVFVVEEDDQSEVAKKIRNGKVLRPSDEQLLRILCMWRLGLPQASIAANSGFGTTRIGYFGIYSGLIELSLINDKVSLPNQGVLSQRNYE